MSSRTGARLLASTVLLAALAAPGRAAHAQAPAPAVSAEDAALAQSLFDEARHLMIADRFAEACPKLAESQRLDPALGTLLNLAVCNERLGKTASAWAEYRDAESIAKREGRAERVTYAHEHATRLEPRLSHLFIVRAEGNVDRGLEVRLDGVAVGEPALGTLIPVDPGTHRIEAAAAQKRRWSVEVTVGERAEKKSVALPPLEDAPVAPGDSPAPPSVPRIPAEGEAGPAASPPLPATPTAEGHASRTLFYVVGTAGMASLAFGAVAGMQAIVRWGDRTKLCNGDACPQGGLDADASARGWALASDVGLGIGAVGIAAATVLFLTSKPAEGPRAGALHVVPAVSSTGGSVGVVGAW